MRSVIDTSALIAGADLSGSGAVAVSVVTIAELQLGVLMAPNEVARGKRLKRLSGVLAEMDALPVDLRVAASYAELSAATRRVGRKATSRNLDLMIAATAHAHGARLLTCNMADVEHLSDLMTIIEVNPAA